MPAVETFFHLTALVFYGVSSGLFFASLLSREQALPRYAFYAITVSAACQIASLLSNVFRHGYLPYESNWEVSGHIGLLLVSVFIVIAWRQHVRPLGALVAPTAMICLGAQMVFSGSLNALNLPLRSAWLYGHLIFSLSADAILSLAGLVSLAYLLQDHFIKHKKLRSWNFFPSIRILDQMGLKLLMLGFLLQSVGMLTGSFLAYHLWGPAWYLDPRQIWSFITWSIFALLLLARLMTGFRGKAANITIIIASLFLLAGLFSMNLLNNTYHKGSYAKESSVESK